MLFKSRVHAPTVPGLYRQGVYPVVLSFWRCHSRPVGLNIMLCDNESWNNVLPPPTQVRPLSPLSHRTCQSYRWDGDSPGPDRGSVYEHVDILVRSSQASFLLMIYLKGARGWDSGYARVLASISVPTVVNSMTHLTFATNSLQSHTARRLRSLLLTSIHTVLVTQHTEVFLHSSHYFMFHMHIF